jgi:predicted XRE-type DNA-binding protein
MATLEELKTLLEDTVFPDIEEAIDDIFEAIANEKNATPEDKEELEELQELRKEITSILEDIENDELSQEECDEIYDEIQNMIQIFDDEK